MEDPCAVLVCITSTSSANISRDGPIINFGKPWLTESDKDFPSISSCSEDFESSPKRSYTLYTTQGLGQERI